MNNFIVNLTSEMRYIFFLFAILAIGCKSKSDTTQTHAKPAKKKRILTGVTVTSVEILQFPKFAPDGEKWDAYAPFATDPDLFVVLKWNENVIYKSDTRNETPFGTAIKFSQGLPAPIKTFDQPLLLEVFDEDGMSSNDNVGYFNFVIKDYEKQAIIELSKGELIIKLGVEWIYN